MHKFNFQMENISNVCSLLIRAVVLGKIVLNNVKILVFTSFFLERKSFPRCLKSVFKQNPKKIFMTITSNLLTEGEEIKGYEEPLASMTYQTIGDI